LARKAGAEFWMRQLLLVCFERAGLSKPTGEALRRRWSNGDTGPWFESDEVLRLLSVWCSILDI
jgi:hypothetical protein